MGDIFLIETAGAIDSAFRAVKLTCSLLGLVLEDAKGQVPSKRLPLLVDGVEINGGTIYARLPDRERYEIIRQLGQFISKGAVALAQAEKMKGRIGQSQSLMFGMYGRALPTEFSTRQYSKNQTRYRLLNDELRELINWRIGILQAAVPRRVYLTSAQPVSVYADASGPGHIGAVAVYGENIKSTRTHLPK